jgi:hypothetical protein
VVLASLAILVGIPIALAVITVARRWRRDSAAPHVRSEARIVEKRSQLTGGPNAPTEQRDYVTFEFPSGERIELAVPGREAGLLVVGDQGTVEWQGSRYLGFARVIMR